MDSIISGISSMRNFQFFAIVLIFLSFVYFISLYQTSQSSIWENEKITSSNMIINTGLKYEFLNPVTQIINHTTSEGIELVGNVTYIVDGDTLDINGVRIRLSLVDTPERGQSGFKEAKDFVSSLCLGKKGELNVDDGQRRGDRYGREIGIVYCNGVNLNKKLMDEQLAKILTDYCDVSEFSKESWAMLQCYVKSNPSSLDLR